MLSRILPLVALAGAGVALAATPLKLQNNFAGADFFNGFNFNITDPPTLTDPNQGNINYVNSSVAMDGPIKLAFVNNAGNVILRVDNVTDNPNPGPFSTFGRNTVQVVSKDPININTLLVASTTMLRERTRVIENINMATHNQYSLHTRSGCTLANSTSFPYSGKQTQGNDCDSAANGNTGCIIQDPSRTSAGPNFAGGVYAMYWSSNGVQIWFFPSSSVPSDLASNSPDPSTWPTPSAAYAASSCDPATFFSPQAIIFDIEVCGALYAGRPDIFNATCPNMGLCTDLVAQGSNYDNAYWEINYVKTFTGKPTPLSNSSSTATSGIASSSTTGSASGSGSTSSASSSSSSNNSSGASQSTSLRVISAIAGIAMANAVALTL